jgi:hypothetical protein
MTEIAHYEPQAGGSMPVITGGQLTHFMDWAKVVAVGSTIPDGLRGKPADVFITVMHGLDLGLRPMQALNLVYVVKGRPSLSAEGMRALVQREGHELRIVELTAEKAVVEGRRKDTDTWHRAEFTDAQRRKAKLSGANWDAYPEDMLFARATTRLCKRFFSDVIGGLPSTEEVMDVIHTDSQRPSLGQVAADRGTAKDEPVDAEVVDDDAVQRAVMAAEAAAQAAQNDEQDPPDSPEELWPDVAPAGGRR